MVSNASEKKKNQYPHPGGHIIVNGDADNPL